MQACNRFAAIVTVVAVVISLVSASPAAAGVTAVRQGTRIVVEVTQ